MLESSKYRRKEPGPFAEYKHRAVMAHLVAVNEEFYTDKCKDKKLACTMERREASP